jgi:AraC-like DNA-binding protein
VKLYIKYMVSSRCKMIVREQLNKLGLTPTAVNLGEAEIKEEITTPQREKLKDFFLEYGLELIEDKKAILIEKIKNVIIETVHFSDTLPSVKFSIYLSEKLNYDYTYLSNVFSQSSGTTIEHFILRHKIERVKELITYNELNLTEIAWKMNYSSVAHLSGQFKKITGLTASNYKSKHQKDRRMLERV